MAIENELHWGRPALTQLLWLLTENRPHCIVAVDRKGARYFRYWRGEMAKLSEQKFDIDISQWKEKELGHVVGQGVRKTRCSQRDTFEHRMDAQYKHICRETAAYVKRLCEAENLRAVFVVGSERLAEPIEAEFPRQFRDRVVRITEDFGGLTLPELQKRLAPKIAEWEGEHEFALVKNLPADDQKAVVGVDETLAQLQKGKIRMLVLARTVHGDLHECIDCGWIDRSADPVCPVCGRERRSVELRETLPDLARSKTLGSK